MNEKVRADVEKFLGLDLPEKLMPELNDETVSYLAAEDLEKLLQAGLPPRGKGRWKHVFETMDRAGRRSRRFYKWLYK